jgi:exodeoxyribonuclease V gamma subunit
VLGDKIPQEQLLAKPALVWRLYRLLPGLSRSVGFSILLQFLKDDTQSRKRYQLAEQLADLFDQYQVYRSDWLSDWANDHDVLRDAKGDTSQLPEAQRWQALLWRALLNDLGTQNSFIASRASVHAEFMAQIDQSEPKLPKRVIVFGLSTLPQQALEVLAKIARFCQVVLFVHNPCQHYWADIIEDKELLKAERQRQKYKAGMSADLSLEELHQQANPLLAAWGKQGRDYLRLLDLFDDQSTYRNWEWPDNKIDLFEDYGDEPQHRSLLQQLQQSILDLEPIPEQPIPLSVIDESLVFHKAHSPQREVEILHDQLLARFNAAEKTGQPLHPRDVIVMVPDINSYAPHIRAVFGQIDQDDKRYIPFSLADQQQRGQNPLLNALEVLLNLPDSRFEVSEFLGLLEVPALRKKFGIDESAIPKLHQWVQESGIRWGLDSHQRQQAVGMSEKLTANTWEFGLQRLLLGYAVGAGQAFNGIEPYADMGGLEAQYLGGLFWIQEKLAVYLHKLRQVQSVEAWQVLLLNLLDDFFVATQERELKTLETLKQALIQWQNNCRQAQFGNDECLPVNIVREAWLSIVDEPNLQQRFLSGRVNFCTLMPMRAIPFKVVCLLGMNDGDYPRTQQAQSFDLMSQRGHYRPGDRSRRQDDHYLFLEAVLSAREQLYISWVGRSVRDNSEIPPSVLISQLRDFMGQSWCPKGMQRLEDKPDKWLEELTVEHPLQPFSVNYLLAEKNSRLFTYSKEWFENDEMTRGAEGVLKTQFDPPKAVSLEALGRFLRAPVKIFCNQTLKFSFEDDSSTSEDNEPFGFDGLQNYQHSDDLLATLKANDNNNIEHLFTQYYQVMVAKGSLPLAGFSKLTFDGLVAPVSNAWAQYQLILNQFINEQPPQAISLDVLIAPAVSIHVTGNLVGLRQNDKGESALIFVTAQSVFKDKKIAYQRLMAYWVNHLASAATGLELRTFIVGADEVLEIEPLNKAEAIQSLEELVFAWYQGLQAPLPVAIRTAFAWLSKGDLDLARKTYEGDDWNNGEASYDAYLNRFFPAFEDLYFDDNEGYDFEYWAEFLYGKAFARIKLVKGVLE